MSKLQRIIKESKIEHRKSDLTFKKDFQHNWSLYLLVLPVIAFYIIFNYVPMYGVVIAFKDYNMNKGILGSDWVGLKHFIDFFHYPEVGRLFRNTLTISIIGLIVGTPMPIILALMLNEIRWTKYRKIVQTISIFPHFVSSVVTCTLIRQFCQTEGLFNQFLGLFGVESTPLLTVPNAFVWILQIKGLWQGVGWNAIIYLAAMAGVDKEIYEAAELDGCTRIQRMRHITVPCIMPTIVLLLIMSVGSLLSVGSEDILLLYNPSIYKTADVISTYTYRKGLVDFDFSYSAAIGLFNSIANIILLGIANKIAKTVSETSLF